MKLDKSYLTMKLYLAFLICILTVQVSYTQLLFSDPTGVAYFEEGSRELEEGNFEVADSLLTLSLKTFKNKNVYFNRSLARIFKQDTIGFCEDLSVSTFRYGDKESELLFNEYCCFSVDTIYYNRRKELSNKSNFKYYEIVKHLKKDDITFGNIFESKGRGSNFYIQNVDLARAVEYLGLVSNNAMATYLVENGKKIYTKTPNPVIVRNYGLYNELNNKLSNYFKSRYNYLKEDKAEPLNLIFKVYFNDLGRCYNVEYFGFYPKIEVSEKDEKIIFQELKRYIKQFPNVKPAKLFGEKVDFVSFDSIEF